MVSRAGDNGAYSGNRPFIRILSDAKGSFFCKQADSAASLCVSSQAKMIMLKNDISNRSTQYAINLK